MYLKYKGNNPFKYEEIQKINKVLFFFFLFSDEKHSSLIERDGGFYSGSSEMGEDYQSDRLENSPSCPTDASEDSIEIKITPIFISKNKRKSHEPTKSTGYESDVPLKKRFKFDTTISREETDLTNTNSVSKNPFRPWIENESFSLSHPPTSITSKQPAETKSDRLPVVTPSPLTNGKCTYEENNHEQPLALVTHKKSTPQKQMTKSKPKSLSHSKLSEKQSGKVRAAMVTVTQQQQQQENTTGSVTNTRPSQQRNYKNMTRERRIEANARERSRVHTISAAFDTLRHTIPSYSHTQKLSKLSVLRIACSYILTLSRMVGDDYSEDQTAPSIADCVADVTKTIQTEGKIRKKKDE